MATDTVIDHNDEQLLNVYNEHWIKYVVPTVTLLFLTGIAMLLFYFAVLSAHYEMWVFHATFLTGLLLITGTHHWYFHRLLSEYTSQIIITNRRAIYLDQSLLFVDDMREVPFRKVRAVEARKHGILQNLLHYGTLWFDIGTEIPLVPHPHAVVKDIVEALAVVPASDPD